MIYYCCTCTSDVEFNISFKENLVNLLHNVIYMLMFVMTTDVLLIHTICPYM